MKTTQEYLDFVNERYSSQPANIRNAMIERIKGGDRGMRFVLNAKMNQS